MIIHKASTKNAVKSDNPNSKSKKVIWEREEHVDKNML